LPGIGKAIRPGLDRPARETMLDHPFYELIAEKIIPLWSGTWAGDSTPARGGEMNRSLKADHDDVFIWWSSS